VDTSVTGSLTSALYLVLSGIHNLLFLVTCTREQCMYKTQQQQCVFGQTSINAVYFRLFLIMPLIFCKFTI